MGRSLISEALKEIASAYQLGTLGWMKVNRPDEWGKMLALEQRINEKALRSDTESLRKALSEYQELILAMVKEFKGVKEREKQEAFNFVERPKSPWTG